MSNKVEQVAALEVYFLYIRSSKSLETTRLGLGTTNTEWWV